MADRPRRKLGRPPLDPTDPTVKLTLSLPGKRYDALYQGARQARMTVPEFIRHKLRHPESDPTGKA
jgi:hypothetical protein